MTKPYKYQAFISYRHADNKEQGRQWATWLHQAIETYEVPNDLVGKTNSNGVEIPARIYPIFRDEEELPADADLGNVIVKALDDTQLLVVLCSPRAVQSTYVSDEIDYFKKLGRSDHIIAAMIDGEPNASWDEGKLKVGFSVGDECFPIPLQFEYDNNGRCTDKHAEPLAADFRINNNGMPEQGWTSIEAYRQHLKSTTKFNNKQIQVKLDTYQKQQNLTLLKIIAGIIGIPLGDLSQRDKAYQLDKAKQKARILKRWLTVVFVLALIALAAGLFAYFKKKEAILQKQIAEKSLDEVRENIDFINLDLREILIRYVPMSKRNKVIEKMDILVNRLQNNDNTSFANKLAVFNALTNKVDVIARSDDLDPNQAMPLIRKAHRIILALVDSYPDNEKLKLELVKSWNNVGDFNLHLSSIKEARIAYYSALNLSKVLNNTKIKTPRYLKLLSQSYNKTGILYTHTGEDIKALKAYEASLELMNQLIELDPDNLSYVEALAEIYGEIGNVHRYVGHLDKSLQAHQVQLMALQKLVAIDQSDNKNQSSLAWAYGHLGQTYMSMMDTDKAGEMLQLEFEIKNRLLESDTENVMLQNDLYWSYVGLAELEIAKIDLNAALLNYIKAHKLIESMIKRQPKNFTFQNNYSFSFVNIADIQLKLGRNKMALNNYKKAHEISTKNANSNPRDIELQLRMVMTGGREAAFYFKSGDYSQALHFYQPQLNILQRLLKQLPNNRNIKKDLYQTYLSLENIHYVLKDKELSINARNMAAEILKELNIKKPNKEKTHKNLSEL